MGKLFEAIRDGGMNRERYWRVMDYAREHFVEDAALMEVGSDDGAFALGFTMLGYKVYAVDPARTPFMAHLYHYEAASYEKSWVGAAKPTAPLTVGHLGQVIEHSKDPEALMSLACGQCDRIIVSAPNFNAGGHLRTYTHKEFIEFVDGFIDIEHCYDIKSDKKPDKYQWLAMGTPLGKK